MVRSHLAIGAGVWLAVLMGCSGSAESQRAIGQAYAGPATLELHQDVSPRSAVVAKVSHGDRLDILARRRRFVKVRTPKGVVGWTDLYKLLASEQMAALNRLAETARDAPSHGEAGVFEALNVHTEPNRQSPSFYQIKEGEGVNVIQYQSVPRAEFKARDVLPPRTKPEPKKPTSGKDSKIPPPPPPPAPKLPDNWIELSKTDLPPGTEAERPQSKPVPIDEWVLVRLKSGRAGWVLVGGLHMKIPDEVAQYSEGHRITSYFKMAETGDGGEKRYQWLWTTLATPKAPYQFDSFRYFIWNTRHHRYETAYIERNLVGYFPVEVHTVEAVVGKKTEKFPGFALIVEDSAGTRYRKTYAYEYYRVVLVKKEAIEAPPAPPPEQLMAASPAAPVVAETEPQDGVVSRWLKRIKQRWFVRK